MRAWQQIAAYAGVALLFPLSVFFLGIAIVQDIKKCKEQYVSQQSPNHRFASGDILPDCFWSAIGGRADSVAYFLTAFATAALVIYTLKLAKISGTQTAQLKRTNDHAAAIERAYVLATVHFKIFDIPHTKDGPREQTSAWVVFKNHGKTPAFLTRLRGYIHMYHVGHGYPTELAENPYNMLMPEGIAIGADEEFRHDFTIDVDEKIASIKDPAIDKVLCLGFIEYRDIFGEFHRTGYCWEHRTWFGQNLAYITPSPLNYVT